ENWLAAIPAIKGDRIIVAEDDDWLHADFIGTLSTLLDHRRLAGLRGDLYYKLPLRKYMRLGNVHHASLACTGFKREMIPFIERCKLHRSVFLDMYLWSEGTQNNEDWVLWPNQADDKRALHVGMKL